MTCGLLTIGVFLALAVPATRHDIRAFRACLEAAKESLAAAPLFSTEFQRRLAAWYRRRWQVYLAWLAILGSALLAGYICKAAGSQHDLAP